MSRSKNSRIKAIVSILLILAAGVFNLYVRGRHDIYGYQDLLSLVYLAICFEWLHSIQKRFLQRNLRRLMTAFAALIVLWNVLRLVKYNLTEPFGVWNRQLWYWYYVPLMLMPVLMFWATLYCGKSDMSALPPKWRLVAVPYLLVMLGILTNDLHQQAFRLEPRVDSWNGRYSYGPLYFIACALILLAVLAVFLVAFRICV